MIVKIINKIQNLYWRTKKAFFNNERYKTISVLEKKINFFIPNQLIQWRVDTILTKEPETLEWIDSFHQKENLIFWDIGANIGLYSIYNALKNKNSTTISFEPSTSNLRTLSRNISINNLENNVKIFTLPLGDKENKFLTMNEGNFIEGGALNSFGVDYDFEGKEKISEMKYQIFGTTINYILKNNILEQPDYIKIDVDGIEHLILKGAGEWLKGEKLKSCLIEINENFTDQYKGVLNTMKENGFRLLHKKNNKELLKNTKFSNVYNYHLSEQLKKLSQNKIPEEYVLLVKKSI